MELLLLPTLLLLSSASLADTYQGSRVSYSTILSGQYVEFFQPFSLCGTLTNFTEQDAQNTITNVGLNESQCTIGCVNKTNDAFRIGIYACGKGADSFTLPISLTDMEFMVDYTDELFVTRGQHGKLRIELHLKPNLTCLHRANVVCIRITKYEMQFESLDELRQFRAKGNMDLGVNKNIWKMGLKNKALKLRYFSDVMMVISLMICVFRCVKHTHA
uniref:Uncharacterized protein n=1 Tax=Anopheles melas TaxID=34690 RepID=A0A182UBT8_9DIPT